MDHVSRVVGVFGLLADSTGKHVMILLQKVLRRINCFIVCITIHFAKLLLDACMFDACMCLWVEYKLRSGVRKKITFVLYGKR